MHRRVATAVSLAWILMLVAGGTTLKTADAARVQQAIERWLSPAS